MREAKRLGRNEPGVVKIDIYTTMLCPYCYRAKKLLSQHGADFTEIDVMVDQDRRR